MLRLWVVLGGRGRGGEGASRKRKRGGQSMMLNCQKVPDETRLLCMMIVIMIRKRWREEGEEMGTRRKRRRRRRRRTRSTKRRTRRSRRTSMVDIEIQ